MIEGESDSDGNEDDILFQNPNHATTDESQKKQVTFISFGYKNGAPGDSINFNIHAKVPNPPNSLRKNRTGMDKELQMALFQNPVVEEVYVWLVSEILAILKEGENTVKIGVGCHSGKHRSVAFVERLAVHPWTTDLNGDNEGDDNNEDDDNDDDDDEEVVVKIVHRDIQGGHAKKNKSNSSRDKRVFSYE